MKPYLVAVGCVGGTLAVRALLSPHISDNIPYLQFVPSILVSSWLGGFGPGALATVLSSVAIEYFVPLAGIDDIIAMALFVLTGLAIASLNDRLRRAHDATRKEAALATARADRLAAIINTTVDGIIVITDRGLIESFNPAAERLFGYAAQEVIGKNVSMLMPSPYHGEHDGYLSRYLSTGKAKIIGVGRQVSGQRKNGTVFPLHLSVGQVTINGERRYTGILHDLTRRVELETELREHSALVRLGEMAAMIAHEVKNPLAGIRGAVQIIGGRMPKDNPDTPMMGEIVKRIDALDAMMKELLVFARPPKPNRAPTDIVPLLSATAGLLKQDEGAQQVHVEIDGMSPPLPADGEMLKMVFHNLLINGAHAMDGRGRIRVQISAEQQSCRISVSDEGPGISPDVRDKIFIPFFTTKRRGTGLGLPTAKRFVEAHDGRISIDCPPSGGTTVTVQLPLA